MSSAQAPPMLPAVEMMAVTEGYLAAFRSAPARLAETAVAWLETIRPPQWALEWSLPDWLGHSFQLPGEAIDRLVLSNVLGLAYIRLQDALADGEMPQIESALSPLISTLLYQRWMGEYRCLFGSDLAFWAHFDYYLTQWLAATTASTEMPAHAFREYGPEDFLRLAHRGAPLKICAAGACLLAGREDQLPALADALDHLLAGAVLLDHAQDWPHDLAAEQYNAFVAYASPLPQTLQHREANVRAVQEQLYLGEAGRPYFQVIRDHLQAADSLAKSVRCCGLQHYLLWLDDQTRACSERLAKSAAAWLDDAVQRLGIP